MCLCQAKDGVCCAKHKYSTSESFALMRDLHQNQGNALFLDFNPTQVGRLDLLGPDSLAFVLVSAPEQSRTSHHLAFARQARELGTEVQVES